MIDDMIIYINNIFRNR